MFKHVNVGRSFGDLERGMRHKTDMEVRSLIGCVIAIVLTASIAHADPQVVVTPRWHPDEPVAPNHTGCLFADDAMRLVVSDNGKQLDRLDFCSSYGRAKAEIATDGRGRRYVLVELGEGRGTNAVTTYLVAYRLNAELLEAMRIPLSWGTGPTQRFSYIYEIGDDNAGGPQITLRGTDETGSECCVPSEKVQIIRIDPEN